MRPLVAPWLSVPLLTAYGVLRRLRGRPASRRWKRWPSWRPPAWGALPEVDLAKAVAKIAEDAASDAWQPVSLLQLNTWSPRWHFFLGTFVGLPSLLLVAAALALPGRSKQRRWPPRWLRIAALAVPWIHARRKHSAEKGDGGLSRNQHRCA